MVRVFDPTRTDPTVITIRGIQDFIYRKTHGLNISEIKTAVERFLSGKEYIMMLEDFKKSEKILPDIVVKNNCTYENFFLQRKKYNFNYFKGAYEPESNKIYLCSNLLMNLLEVKENLDRELVLAYDHQVRGFNLEKDADVACSLVRSCRAQLDNYKWNEDLTMEMTRLCARNLFKVSV